MTPDKIWRASPTQPPMTPRYLEYPPAVRSMYTEYTRTDTIAPPDVAQAARVLLDAFKDSEPPVFLRRLRAIADGAKP